MSVTGRLRAAARRTPVTATVLAQAERLSSLVAVLRSGGFDVGWYAAQRTGTDPAAGRPAGRLVSAAWAAHYVWRGRRAGLSPHPLVEPEFAFPVDWARSGADPLARLLRGRPRYPIAPHPLVDPTAWLARHPDAAAHRFGWLGHLLAHADAGTALPLPGWARCGPLTVGDARRLALDGVAAWRADEARRRAPRVTPSFDAAAAAALVAAHAGPWPAGACGSSSPLVSVVMPVRDRQDVVGTAVRSVLDQTLVDLELLVVDDGSVDGTVEAVLRAAGGDPRLVVVEGSGARGSGSGVSAARNRGAARARGRWLAWLDSDNTWAPAHLRTVVGELERRGERAGYATVEAVTAVGGRRYRGFDPGPARQVPFLEVANHVDLNVLVVRRDLLGAIGGFDESLRRTVDYDLVWRLAQAAPLLHVPVVGAVYVEDLRADRITVREPASWREVVKNRRLLDWPALAAAVPARTPGRVSVLVAAAGSWQGAWSTARTALDGAEGLDVEVCVTDDRTPRGSGLVLRALAVLDERVRVARTPVEVHRALATNLAFAASTGARVALVQEGTVLWPGWAAAAEALDDPEVVAATVPVAGQRGELLSAGGVPAGGWALPADLLAGLPPADAFRLAGNRAAGGCLVSTPAAELAVVRAGELAAAGGLDPLLVDGGELADLALRLAGRDGDGDGGPRARVALVATGPAQRATGSGLPAASRRLLADRHDLSAAPAAGALWAAAGFDVASWQPDADADPSGAVPAVPVPLLARVRRPDAVLADSREVPRLRWSIATSEPAGPAALRCGDHHFAHALAAALGRLGQEVAVDHRDAYDRPSGRFDDVRLVLRGLRPVPPRADPSPPDQAAQIRLLWVISHPEDVPAAEVAGYDRAFSAGPGWGAGLADRHGGAVEVLLQATDPARFRPDADSGAGAGDVPAEPVLFVGNSRGVYRPLVRTLVEAGVDVAVYGARWAEFLGPAAARVVRAEYVPNDRLPALYARAGVVLNDHWEGMRASGFVSNRLFDAAACGARVLTDRVAGPGDLYEQLFGGLVRGYADDAELVRLVEAAPAGWPDDARRRELAATVAAQHSFDARAGRLLDAALAVRAAG